MGEEAQNIILFTKPQYLPALQPNRPPLSAIAPPSVKQMQWPSTQQGRTTINAEHASATLVHDVENAEPNKH